MDDLLAYVFSNDGLIAQSLEDYEEREGQKAMAEQVLNAYQNDLIALTEAGTGIGKSLAYLAAAMLWAAKRKERTVISTHTITLQHQLLEKDIPFLTNALEIELKTVLVKGMQNYLCLRKLEDAEVEVDRDYNALKIWSETTKTGCRTTLPFSLNSSSWDRYAADAMSCTASRCPNFRNCFFFKARREAEEAQILIVNHYLLLTHINGNEEKGILPEFHRLIIDEAHRLEDAAIDVFSQQCDWIGLIKLINSFPIEIEGQKTEILRKLEKAFFLLRDTIRDTKTAWQEEWCERLKTPFHEAAEEMVKWCVMCENHCKNNEEDPLVSLLAERLQEHAKFLRSFFEHKGSCVRWIEKEENTIHLIEAPLDVPEMLKEKLFGNMRTAALCSATLCQGKDFSFLKKQLGLGNENEITEAVFHSPFDYQNRVFFAVASDLPEPSSKEFAASALGAIEQLIRASNGGALVLFTATEMLHEVYNSLCNRSGLREFTFLRQGDLGRTTLLQRFVETDKAVLLGVDSFWEGLDIAGSSLRLVIIVKLPFHPLGDPLIEAMQTAIEENGGNPFYEYSVPKAVMKFKQAFGRLMRKKEDSGAVVCLDKRIYTKGYGKKFLEVLPSCPKIFTTIQEIKERIGA
jgi:ATP-dependent DNA helicase DinG